MKNKAVFALFALLVTSAAIGANCYSTEANRAIADEANQAACKEQAKGNVNKYLKCMDDCERTQRAVVDQRKQAEIDNLGEGAPCWKPSIGETEYIECAKALSDEYLGKEVESMTRGCTKQGVFCDYRTLAEREHRERMDAVGRATAVAREAELQAKLERDRKARAEELATEEKAEAEKKRVCGADYRKVRIGMDFARVKQCLGEFRLVSEINRTDGVVSVYERGGGLVYVMNGRVTAWHAP